MAVEREKRVRYGWLDLLQTEQQPLFKELIILVVGGSGVQMSWHDHMIEPHVLSSKRNRGKDHVNIR